MIEGGHGPSKKTKRKLISVFMLTFILVLWGSPDAHSQQASSQSTKGDQSPAVIAGGNVTINYYGPSEFSKPDLNLGVALYVYEKAFILQDQTKTYYMEMRNLISNCSIYRQEVKGLPRGRSVIPEPGAWILMKLRLENISYVPLTNLRLGLRGMALAFDTFGSTPNVKASISHEFTMNKGLGTDVVIIESLAPGDKAIVTLQAKIDQKRYLELREAPRHTIIFPFIVSNQFKASNLKVVKFDASEMLKQEAELFTGERTTVNEKIDFRLLGPAEPSVNEELINYALLPPTTQCPTGTTGDW